MSTHKKRVLIDCDGVLADFANAALQLIEERTGVHYCVDDIKQWDLFKAINKPSIEHVLNDAVEHGDFCINLKPYLGAKEFMVALNSLYDVYVVTSPFLARNWAYERTRWLECHFDIPAKKVAHVKDKKIVYGDVLIDDSVKNLNAWKAAWPDKLAILMHASWNENEEFDGPRVRSYTELADILDKEFLRKATAGDLTVQ